MNDDQQTIALGEPKENEPLLIVRVIRIRNRD